MTQIIEKTVKCPICGNPVEIYQYLSFFSYGQYLDTKYIGGDPYYLNYCEKCNYVSPDFEEEPSPKVKAVIASKEYKYIFTKAQKESTPIEVLKLLAQIHIRKALNAPDMEIGYLYLKLAWCGDDSAWITSDIPVRGRVVSLHKAKEYRLEAIKYFEKSNKEKDRLVLVDLYRRTGQFDKASRLLSETNFSEQYAGICKQQKELVAVKDIEEHKIEHEDKLKGLGAIIW